MPSTSPPCNHALLTRPRWVRGITTWPRLALAAAACVALLTACRGPAPEPNAAERGSGLVEVERPLPAPVPPTPQAAGEDDDQMPFPSFGLEAEAAIMELPTRYTKDLQGAGPLFAVFDTTAGQLRCRLFEEQTPHTVDNFVGLARGLKPWRDPTSGESVRRPFYDGLTFHRVVPGLLIQSGDPTGTGMGHPGFAINDEFAPGLSHNQPGVMAMAQTRPNGGGSQFFITDGPAPHFDGRYPIFGLCGDHDVIHAIAAADTGASRVDRPQEPVRIRSIRFEREASGRAE